MTAPEPLGSQVSKLPGSQALRLPGYQAQKYIDKRRVFDSIPYYTYIRYEILTDYQSSASNIPIRLFVL